ncbi:MAG: hypothetical protein Q7K44_03615 [Candidatus Liptonbacteria bacterium]|nr:hypothetical protein [Candidatus Liptonbacteria bacterium]
MEQYQNNSQKISKEKSDKDIAREIFKTYSSIISTIAKGIEKSRSIEIKEYKETIRNLILTNGAIAAFSLPSLGNSSILKGPLIISILFSLLNILIAYWHLQIGWTKSFKSFIDAENRVIGPLNKIREVALETIRGKAHISDLILKDKEFKKEEGEFDRIHDYLSKLSVAGQKLNHADTVLLISSSLAIIFLIYAIAGNYISEFWSHLVIYFLPQSN